jgi:quinol-cytochrome oxidoreductase complex cytochrome b subunit
MRDGRSRSEPLSTHKGRIQLVLHNFWLHVHPPQVHPSHLAFRHTWYAGLVSFHLFLILTITGLPLMVYYTPHPEQAYQDMKDLGSIVFLGTFLRNLHRWAAHAMIIAVVLHMFRVFLSAAYRGGRKLNWMIGAALLPLTLLLSFTGYLLPWDQLAFWAITVGAGIAAYTPAIGEQLRIAILGGHDVAGPALLRFYVLHCVVLPLIAGILILVHFWRIRKDGGLAPAWHGEAETEKLTPAYPFAFLRELNSLLLTTIALMVCSLLWNAPLQEQANPTVTPNPAKSPWYFLGVQEMVSYNALWGGVIAPVFMMAAAFVLPYLDRTVSRRPRDRWLAIALFSSVLLANTVLIVIGVYFRGPGWEWRWPWANGVLH